MEDDRVSLLEMQLNQAKLIAEEADKKYEEVLHGMDTELSVGSTTLYGGGDTHTHDVVCIV